jgi:hypothetical protein
VRADLDSGSLALFRQFPFTRTISNYKTIVCEWINSKK